MKKKVCVVTAARSEYGLLRWIIMELFKYDSFETIVIAAGTHLSKKYGYTLTFIQDDNIKVSKCIDYLSDGDSLKDVSLSMSKCLNLFSDAFIELKPDLLVVLGDRYELLSICGAAILQNIPIAHIAGGEVTEGAIDDKIRNAVTMMSDIHFPNNSEAYSNIVRMIGTSKYVFNVGEPGIENFVKMNLLDRKTLSKILGICEEKDWLLVTLHPETKLSIEDNMTMVSNMIKALKCFSLSEIIITEANSDFGGGMINRYYDETCSNCNFIHVYSSLGQLNFLSLMKEAKCVIGNSSSGIIETPYLGVPTINIGNRQKCRFMSNNIISVGYSYYEIYNAICSAMSKGRYEADFTFGDGMTSKYIAQHIKDYLYDKKYD